MKIEFKSQTTVRDIKEAIYLHGEEIGWVETNSSAPDNDSSRCHAGIILPRCGYTSLIQGHGATKEAAILAAIVDGRRNYQRAIVAIDSLERELCA